MCSACASGDSRILRGARPTGQNFAIEWQHRETSSEQQNNFYKLPCSWSQQWQTESQTNRMRDYTSTYLSMAKWHSTRGMSSRRTPATLGSLRTCDVRPDPDQACQEWRQRVQASKNTKMCLRYAKKCTCEGGARNRTGHWAGDHGIGTTQLAPIPKNLRDPATHIKSNSTPRIFDERDTWDKNISLQIEFQTNILQIRVFCFQGPPYPSAFLQSRCSDPEPSCRSCKNEAPRPQTNLITFNIGGGGEIGADEWEFPTIHKVLYG